MKYHNIIISLVSFSKLIEELIDNCDNYSDISNDIFQLNVVYNFVMVGYF